MSRHLIATRFLRCCGLAVILHLAACAPAVMTMPATYVPVTANESREVRTVTSNTKLMFKTGYSRVLPAGSRWERAGSIAQGPVFRPVDAVFSIEGRQVHEAWLVIVRDTLIGFYLPAETNFSAADSQIPLLFNKENK